MPKTVLHSSLFIVGIQKGTGTNPKGMQQIREWCRDSNNDRLIPDEGRTLAGNSPDNGPEELERMCVRIYIYIYI